MMCCKVSTEVLPWGHGSAGSQGRELEIRGVSQMGIQTLVVVLNRGLSAEVLIKCC